MKRVRHDNGTGEHVESIEPTSSLSSLSSSFSSSSSSLVSNSDTLFEFESMCRTMHWRTIASLIQNRYTSHEQRELVHKHNSSRLSVLTTVLQAYIFSFLHVFDHGSFASCCRSTNTISRLPHASPFSIDLSRCNMEFKKQLQCVVRYQPIELCVGMTRRNLHLHTLRDICTMTPLRRLSLVVSKAMHSYEFQGVPLYVSSVDEIKKETSKFTQSLPNLTELHVKTNEGLYANDSHLLVDAFSSQLRVLTWIWDETNTVRGFIKWNEVTKKYDRSSDQKSDINFTSLMLCSQLHTLTLRYSCLDEKQWIEVTQQMSSLTSLHLTFAKSGFVELKSIGNLSNLKSLRLATEPIVSVCVMIFKTEPWLNLSHLYLDDIKLYVESTMFLTSNDRKTTIITTNSRES